jgi:hypothetical protein
MSRPSWLLENFGKWNTIAHAYLYFICKYCTLFYFRKTAYAICYRYSVPRPAGVNGLVKSFWNFILYHTIPIIVRPPLAPSLAVWLVPLYSANKRSKLAVALSCIGYSWSRTAALQQTKHIGWQGAVGYLATFATLHFYRSITIIRLTKRCEWAKRHAEKQKKI